MRPHRATRGLPTSTDDLFVLLRMRLEPMRTPVDLEEPRRDAERDEHPGPDVVDAAVDEAPM